MSARKPNPPREIRRGDKDLRVPPPKPESTPAEVLYGLRAGLAVFERRREEIQRIVLTPTAKEECRALLEWAAEKKLSVREANDAELERVADSPQHEGLCLFVRPRKWLSVKELAERLVRTKGAVVALDRVRNPYNVGAILRTAAFFGFDGALLGASAPHPALAPLAVRVAEGGAEHLALARTTDLAETLSRLRSSGIRVIGAESDATRGFAGFSFERPVVLVMGHEREGLSERVRAQCDGLVKINGSGSVGSLNVSVAAGILLAEVMRNKR